MAAGATGCRRPASNSAAMSSAAMPVLFLAHGSPQLLDDQGWVAELGACERPRFRGRGES